MEFSDKTEEKLVNEARTNANAFSELYRRYVKKIYNFFYYHTFNISESEDLTSITFEKALSHLNTLKPQTNFSAWIYKIAHNSLIDFYRQNNKYKNQQNIEDIQLITETNFEHDLEKKELVETKNQAEQIIYLAQKNLEEWKDKIPPQTKESISQKIEDLKKSLESNDRETIQSKLSELSSELQNIGKGMYNQKEEPSSGDTGEEQSKE